MNDLRAVIYSDDAGNEWPAIVTGINNEPRFSAEGVKLLDSTPRLHLTVFDTRDATGTRRVLDVSPGDGPHSYREPSEA